MSRSQQNRNLCRALWSLDADELKGTVADRARRELLAGGFVVERYGVLEAGFDFWKKKEVSP